MINFDLKTAQSLVNDAIALKGEDFVYERQVGNDCLYVHRPRAWDADVNDYVGGSPAPGCVWGHALMAAGVDEDIFDSLEGNDVEEVLCRLKRGGHVGEINPIASAWAYAVQFAQDTGSSWGDARSKANSILKEAMEDTSLETDEDRAGYMRNSF